MSIRVTRPDVLKIEWDIKITPNQISYTVGAYYEADFSVSVTYLGLTKTLSPDKLAEINKQRTILEDSGV